MSGVGGWQHRNAGAQPRCGQCLQQLASLWARPGCMEGFCTPLWTRCRAAACILFCVLQVCGHRGVHLPVSHGAGGASPDAGAPPPPPAASAAAATRPQQR